MKKPDLSDFSGQELFEYYTSKGGEYAQTLNQAFVEIREELFEMLEQAEKQGKKIIITEDIDDVMDSPVTISIG